LINIEQKHVVLLVIYLFYFIFFSLTFFFPLTYFLNSLSLLGNYYSLRSEHKKAILYFERCLKLNSNYFSAWTLMGHEYIQIKNTNAAIEAYRRAIGT